MVDVHADTSWSEVLMLMTGTTHVPIVDGSSDTHATELTQRWSVRTATRASWLLTALLVISVPEAVSGQHGPLARSAPASRIAIYDSRVVFDSMPERSALESEFALEQAKARLMVTAASDSLRLALDQLVENEQRLTPREREAGKLNLRARELLVEQMLENLDAVMQRRLDELRGPLVRRLREAVRVVRVRLGYNIAIDRATDAVEIDADDSVDITHAIVIELRRADTRSAPGETNSAPARSVYQRGRG